MSNRIQRFAPIRPRRGDVRRGVAIGLAYTEARTSRDCVHSLRTTAASSACSQCVQASGVHVNVRRVEAPTLDTTGKGWSALRSSLGTGTGTAEDEAPARRDSLRGFGGDRPGKTSERVIAKFLDAVDRGERLANSDVLHEDTMNRLRRPGAS